jgi:phosphomannomutase / phosphoglucomutase
MSLTKDIFRAYDIRGVFPEQLNKDNIKDIAKALGTLFVRKDYKNIVVGRDNRASSFDLCSGMVEGLLSTGCNVLYVDITIQPAIHFFTFQAYCDAGVNITASHNPKNYNGVKVDFKQAHPCFGNEIQEIYNIAESQNFVVGRGEFTEKNLNSEYVDYVSSRFKFTKKTKIVIDCGSGATSSLAPAILQKSGANVVPVFCEYDSTFPHDVPDPEKPVFVAELKKKVKEFAADVGFCYDGDGDRIGVVDEKGNAYHTDQLLMLFSHDILPKNPGRSVLYDVKSSELTEKVIRESGGMPRMMPTGRGFFLEEIQKGLAILGAELSGHVFFNDCYFGYDDAIYTTCRVLELMGQKNMPLSKLMADYPVLPSTPELKVPCPDAKKFEVVRDIEKKIKEAPLFKKIITIDGVRAYISATGWLLIRASNTSPYLSFRAEGKDNKEVDQLIKHAVKLLSAYDFVDFSELKR